LILKLEASTGFGVGTAIDLGPVVDVWNIRLNPNNGLLYAPDFIGNTVAVIDPSDDSFVLKAGFEAPWDVVFTSSKAIAVQHSAEGLKEIV
jgi:DNA-binding beta-propeller fold protein YncE